MSLLRRCKFACATLSFLVLPRWAAAQERPDYSKLFDKTAVMIPARDGVKLHTEIYSPKDASEPLPIIFERTPYGLSDDAKGYSRILYRYAELIPEDYIFVFQDIRGRYGSEGKFVIDRKSTRLNSSHGYISYAVFCLKKKKKLIIHIL